MTHPRLSNAFTARMYSHLFMSVMRIASKPTALRALAVLRRVVNAPNVHNYIGPRSFNFLFVALSRVALIDEARDVADMCYSVGYYLNRYSYNALLNACAKKQRLDVAFSTLKEMAEHHVSPDVVSFNVLISCCVRAGSVDIALNILSRMKHWNIKPDVYSYNSVINGLRKSNMLDQAFELVAEMERESQPTSASIVQNALGVAPDLVTYNTLLSALASLSCPQFDRAIRVKRHMESRGIKPNEVSYNALMATAAKADRVKDAFHIYDQMVSRGLRPNCECFTTLITLCGRANMLDKAFEVHDHMLASNIRPNVITYNALLTACRGTTGGNTDRALAILHTMRTTGGCEPDVITYSTVIDVLGRNECFDHMMRVFEEMKQQGIEPNLVTYTSMIAGMTRANKMEEALQILDDMKQHGIEPNVYTFSSLINGASKRGDFESAMDILQLMREKGIWPSCITYTMLLQLALKIGKRSVLTRVLDEMKADVRVVQTKLQRLGDYVARLELAAAARNRTVLRRIAELVEECVQRDARGGGDRMP
eukprot:gb/GEZJ01002947.1/.p1 GENE.gb/GEZJ01002947.1/~~gb/GEZJ01002947.1/.p1  ORF type:complete len:593 (+),score=103.67 gb/GEZJ01002947.1/:165-1781(+)